MASAFGHAIVSYTLKKTSLHSAPIKVTLLAMFCAIFPDADVITLKFGIPYEHMFGHRGFTHSIFFAIVFGFFISIIFHRKDQFKYALLYMAATISHPILDAMTTGGRGIAFFAPFSDERMFFPWRFIKVSPMSIQRFFSDWGVQVLISEWIYLWVPCLIILFINFIIRKYRKKVN